MSQPPGGESPFFVSSTAQHRAKAGPCCGDAERLRRGVRFHTKCTTPCTWSRIARHDALDHVDRRRRSGRGCIVTTLSFGGSRIAQPIVPIGSAHRLSRGHRPAVCCDEEGYASPRLRETDQFSNTKASCSHHGRSAAAMRSLIESEHGRRWATSLSRTIGER